MLTFMQVVLICVSRTIASAMFIQVVMDQVWWKGWGKGGTSHGIQKGETNDCRAYELDRMQVLARDINPHLEVLVHHLTDSETHWLQGVHYRYSILNHYLQKMFDECALLNMQHASKPMWAGCFLSWYYIQNIFLCNII